MKKKVPKLYDAELNEILEKYSLRFKPLPYCLKDRNSFKQKYIYTTGRTVRLSLTFVIVLFLLFISCVEPNSTLRNAVMIGLTTSTLTDYFHNYSKYARIYYVINQNYLDIIQELKYNETTNLRFVDRQITEVAIKIKDIARTIQILIDNDTILFSEIEIDYQTMHGDDYYVRFNKKMAKKYLKEVANSDENNEEEDIEEEDIPIQNSDDISFTYINKLFQYQINDGYLEENKQVIKDLRRKVAKMIKNMDITNQEEIQSIKEKEDMITILFNNYLEPFDYYYEFIRENIDDLEDNDINELRKELDTLQNSAIKYINDNGKIVDTYDVMNVIATVKAINQVNQVYR